LASILISGVPYLSNELLDPSMMFLDMMMHHTFFRKSSVILVLFVFAILCRPTAGAVDGAV